MGERADIPADTVVGGKIRLIRRIGRGGMGDVWIARNEATQAELAVKTLQRSERTPIHDERFRREARLSATISHRNVVRVFDLVDETNGTLGLVMELLRGATLEGCLQERGRLTPLQALAVALPVLAAMHHVHHKGIVHRDMKPANVFLSVEPDGHVIPKILDFGIAKLPAAGSALTMDGSVLGTPHYMSPEQIRGQEDIDGRTDMFSFAVVLYEMLTGVRIFQRDTASASLAAVLEHEVDPDPRIEPRLWLAMSRALAKRPYERYASCAEFAAALRSAIDVSDEEVTQSLQELRPQKSMVSVNGPSGSRGSSGSSLAVATSPRVEAARPRSGLTVAAIAVGAALLAAGLVLTITRLPATPGDRAPPPSTVVEPPRRDERTEIPPPPVSVSATSEEPRSWKTETVPALTSTSRSPSPHVRRPYSPSTEKRSPTKPKGGVATTPGF